ncbi:putative chromatin remodeling & transcriptional activation CHROMO-DOMAIN family [Helianthus annuus]|nr:putative chromatin remodeling & transcriptional activation CHROMO-DOMAIN family [Helianthus annuus]
MDDIEVDKKLNYVERPVAIKDFKVKHLRNKSVRQVLVQWQHRKGSDLTWEAEDDMQKHYPELFGTHKEGRRRKSLEGTSISRSR